MSANGINKRILITGAGETEGVEFTPFDSALKELYGWYRDNLDKIDKDEIVRDAYLKYCRRKP